MAVLALLVRPRNCEAYDHATIIGDFYNYQFCDSCDHGLYRLPVNDAEDMSFVIGRDLDGNEDDATPVKHLLQAVAHLYKRVQNLSDENDELRWRVEHLESR